MKKLNKEQILIVKHRAGHALVNAGAGCGKTTVLIHRILYLLDHGVDPRSILVLTFSKHTAVELKKRLAETNHTHITDGVVIKTFHAFGLLLIQKYYRKFGYTKPPAPVKSARQGSANAVSLPEMLELPAHLIKSRPRRFEEMISEYKHLLVDELQDVERLQTRILLALAQSKYMKSTVLVGDKKQMIFGFREASLVLWKKIEKTLEPTIYPLRITYRLKENSLPFVNGLGKEICDDPPLIPAIKSSLNVGLKPKYRRFNDFDQQAEFMVEEIRRLQGEGVKLSEIAILCRCKWNLSRMCISLKGNKIAHTELYREKVDGIDILERPASYLVELLKVVQALKFVKRAQYRKVLMNYREQLSRIIGWLVGAAGMEQDIAEEIVGDVLTHGLSAINIPRKTHPQLHERLKALRDDIESALNSGNTGPESTCKALEGIVMWAVKKHHPGEWPFHQREVSYVGAQIRKYDWENLTMDIDDLFPSVGEDSVQLTTVHGAKGKEWHTVFVMDCVHGVFPSYRAKTPKKIDEERRVFYVAVTRHKQQLYILSSPVPRQAYLKGKKRLDILDGNESQFITAHRKTLNVMGKKNIGKKRNK